jgi:hypothetical protein
LGTVTWISSSKIPLAEFHMHHHVHQCPRDTLDRLLAGWQRLVGKDFVWCWTMTSSVVFESPFWLVKGARQEWCQFSDSDIIRAPLFVNTLLATLDPHCAPHTVRSTVPSNDVVSEHVSTLPSLTVAPSITAVADSPFGPHPLDIEAAMCVSDRPINALSVLNEHFTQASIARELDVDPWSTSDVAASMPNATIVCDTAALMDTIVRLDVEISTTELIVLDIVGALRDSPDAHNAHESVAPVIISDAIARGVRSLLDKPSLTIDDTADSMVVVDSVPTHTQQPCVNPNVVADSESALFESNVVPIVVIYSDSAILESDVGPIVVAASDSALAEPCAVLIVSAVSDTMHLLSGSMLVEDAVPQAVADQFAIPSLPCGGWTRGSRKEVHNPIDALAYSDDNVNEFTNDGSDDEALEALSDSLEHDTISSTFSGIAAPESAAKGLTHAVNKLRHPPSSYNSLHGALRVKLPPVLASSSVQYSCVRHVGIFSRISVGFVHKQICVS